MSNERMSDERMSKFPALFFGRMMVASVFLRGIMIASVIFRQDEGYLSCCR